MKVETPHIGMGVTLCYPNDSYPYTIVEIKSARCVFIQEDEAKRIDDRGPYTENQEYNYSRNKDAPKVKITLRKNGNWYRVGESMRRSPFVLGHRRYYRDPHI